MELLPNIIFLILTPILAITANNQLKSDVQTEIRIMKEDIIGIKDTQETMKITIKNEQEMTKVTMMSFMELVKGVDSRVTEAVKG